MTNVKKLMSSSVTACRPETPLTEVAQLMWERDCGFMPITEGKDDRLVGVITDRDICMAAFVKGVPLANIATRDVTTGRTFTCTETDDLATVHELMRKHQVRRLPVVDETNRLLGVLSLNDLALNARTEKREAAKVAQTLAAVCQHWQEIADAPTQATTT